MVTNSFGNRNFTQPANGKAQHPLKVPWFFFLLSFGWKREDFPLFPTCSLSSSQWVPIEFPLCSLCLQSVPRRVFPIAPCFNLICFAQSPPLLTHIGGPKEEAIHLSIESSIMGNLHSFNFVFCNGPIKLAHCKKKKKKGWTWKQKQNNKYPQE